jgi:putative molybdopterin biosynthesis protein
MQRNIYLKMKTLEEAREILFHRFQAEPTITAERIPVTEAVGRILSAPVFANFSSPAFHAAAMDGIALRAESSFGVSEKKPKTLRIGSEAFFVNTGHVMPSGTNAVVMIENLQMPDAETVQIEAPAVPWQHVRKMGEDIVATELLFPRNRRVTPYCVGAMLSGGVFSVSVKKKPKVLLIPTGSELVDLKEAERRRLEPGEVLETNSHVLAGLAEALGAAPIRHPNIIDDPEMIREGVREAVRTADIVLVLGGSSAGSEDFARKAISEIGEVLVHGVTIMPGKPVIIGAVGKKPVFGMPGYPVSSIIAFEQLVASLISRMLGQPEPEREEAEVVPTRNIASRLGIEEFLRVKLGAVGGRIVATPLPRGAGSITSITEADGIIRIPNGVEGVKAGEPVTATLLRPLSDIRNTLVAVGSHDNTLDLLADRLRAGERGISLSSSHVGSMGGLMAIKKGGCHFAGSHLLDTTDGTYNLSYIRRYLPEVKVRVVNLVLRDQGLIVPRGNPKKIAGIADLSREDIVFINRQGGSGTRILLDYRLKELGIEPETIRGYETEEFTHMSVAAAVLSGAADAGLGIQAAAKALDLDFIPVVTEQYDLVIPEIYYETGKIRTLLDIVRGDEFKGRVAALGGYHTDRTGEIIL